MADDLNDSEERWIQGYLTRWGAEVRQGRARMPAPPGRSTGAEQIVRAVEAAADARKPRADVDLRLLGIAAQAAVTGFEPWTGVPRRQAPRSRWAWAAAAAACIPLLFMVGVWQKWSPDDIAALEPSLDLYVGYGDLEALERGSSALRPGTRANLMFTLAQPARYTILLLDQDLELSCVLRSRRGAAGRQQVEWYPAAEAGRSIRETVFVVAGRTPWGGAEGFLEDLASRLTGSREDRIRVIRAALHARLHRAVADRTYVVSPPRP